MSPPEDISKMFESESEKLDSLLKAVTTQELYVHEVIEAYYQVINVSSTITMLRQQMALSDASVLLEKISKAEKKISEFNSNIHPKILAELTASIAEATRSLQAQSPHQQTQKEAEENADAYEELKQKMSTREFVEQYDNGLSNDP